jgi:alkaline phosphatase D
MIGSFLPKGTKPDALPPPKILMRNRNPQAKSPTTTFSQRLRDCLPGLGYRDLFRLRNLLFSCLLLFGLTITTGAETIHQAQGQMAGEPTATSIFLQSRLTSISGPETDATGAIPGSAGFACFEWSKTKDFSQATRTDWMTAAADNDFIVRAKVIGLESGQRYYYRLVFGDAKSTAKPGPIGEFQTLPDSSATKSLSFCLGSCMNYHAFMSGKANGGGPVTATADDKRLGYPAFAAMHSLKPDFFIGAGDIVYYDHPSSHPARSLEELRKKWHEQFRFPRLIEFFATTPSYWLKDDHDFRFNDADMKGESLPIPSTGIQLFREQMPLVAVGDNETPTYRTHRVHKHLQLWFLEGRDFRSPNAMEDGPGKSIWGEKQRAWLQKTLLASDATWKILVTPTPMVGPDTASKKDNHANLKGFRHEADDFFAWLRENQLTNVLTMCGDRHWQYHSIHPSGVEEFSAGALNDENSIRGVAPGNKNSSDPEGLVKQPYRYPEPTGGFLRVVIEDDSVKHPSLLIEFRDDQGTLLHAVEKNHHREP